MLRRYPGAMGQGIFNMLFYQLIPAKDRNLLGFEVQTHLGEGQMAAHFLFTAGITRSNSWTLNLDQCRQEIRHNVFNREDNSSLDNLPSAGVDSPLLVIFKARLDVILRDLLRFKQELIWASPMAYIIQEISLADHSGHF